MMSALERRLDRLGHALLDWWVWPAVLIGIAGFTLVASWSFLPGDGEAVAWLGRFSFPMCPVLRDTGVPCGQCGMTRSWVWASRGHFLRAWLYNPAGFVLWGWFVAGGLVGIARIARRDAALWAWSLRWLVAALISWSGLYFAAYQLRSWGWNPLP